MQTAMQITVDRSALRRGVEMAARAGFLVLIEAGASLTVEGRGHECTFRTIVPAEVHAPGRVVFDAAILRNLISHLSDEPIRIEYSGNERVVNSNGSRVPAAVVRQGARMKIQVVDPDSLPEAWPSPSGTDSRILRAAPTDLAAGLRQVVYAHATDGHEMWSAVHVRDGGDRLLALWATDGYRLAHTTVTGTATGDRPEAIGIPRAALPAVQALIADAAGEVVEVVADALHLEVHCGVDVVRAARIDCGVDFHRVVPQGVPAHAITVGVAELVEAVHRVRIFDEGKMFLAVPDAQTLKLTTSSPVLGDGEDMITAEVLGTPSEDRIVRLSPKYLKQALGAISSSKVVIKVWDPERPVLIAPVEGPGIHVIMQLGEKR